jgi:hypothetical protein
MQLLSPVFAPLHSRISVGYGCSSAGIVDVASLRRGRHHLGGKSKSSARPAGNARGEFSGIWRRDPRRGGHPSPARAGNDGCRGGILHGRASFPRLRGHSRSLQGFSGAAWCVNNNDVEGRSSSTCPRLSSSSHGAVSAEETAVAMAAGAQEKLDSTTLSRSPVTRGRGRRHVHTGRQPCLSALQRRGRLVAQGVSGGRPHNIRVERAVHSGAGLDAPQT